MLPSRYVSYLDDKVSFTLSIGRSQVPPRHLFAARFRQRDPRRKRATQEGITMRRPSARRLTALAAAAVLLPVTAACGSGEGDDKGEKSALVIYSGRQEKLVKPLLNKLEKAV